MSEYQGRLASKLLREVNYEPRGEPMNDLKVFLFAMMKIGSRFNSLPNLDFTPRETKEALDELFEFIEGYKEKISYSLESDEFCKQQTIYLLKTPEGEENENRI